LPSTKAMSNANAWVHHSVSILGNCRTTHLEPEATEDQEMEPEELMKQVEAADPFEPRLKHVTTDKQVQVSKSQKISPWVVRLMGDSTEYLDNSG